MARKGASRVGRLGGDGYLAFAIFAAVGAATWPVGQPLRLTLMWLVLLAFTLLCASGQRIQLSYTLSDLARGGAAGLLVSVPVVLLAGDSLIATTELAFPWENSINLVWGLVFLMPVVEALFFRGLVQPEKGLGLSVLLYAAAGLVYFLPATWDEHLPVLGLLIGGMGLLGFVYGYVRAIHGLLASLVCQAMAHLVLLIVPALAQGLGVVGG
jgi:membrane protease YdiL (CAAX protease family)